MSELILHHYEISSYSEKVRAILGFKGLAWRSVIQPMIMPKPDLVALTGGYRLLPVLQIGADIWCDSLAIARRLDQEQPDPPLVPQGSEATVRGLSVWGESIFGDLVMIYFATGTFSEEFIEDRKKWGVNLEAMKALAPAKRGQLRAKLDLLEQQLRDGRSFLLGDTATLADFSTYHPLWSLRDNEEEDAVLGPFPRLVAWRDRIAGFEHRASKEIDPAEAVAIAAASAPLTTERTTEDALPAGQPIVIRHEPYGPEKIKGDLVALDAQEIAVLCTNDRAGETVVHFPREGFLIRSAAPRS